MLHQSFTRAFPVQKSIQRLRSQKMLMTQFMNFIGGKISEFGQVQFLSIIIISRICMSQSFELEHLTTFQAVKKYIIITTFTKVM